MLRRTARALAPARRVQPLLRFVGVGFANTMLAFLIIGLLRTPVGDALANAAAYLVVVPLSFASHRRLSFRHDGALAPAALRYAGVVAAGYALNYLLLSALDSMGIAPLLAQACAIAGYVAFTFAGFRCLVFAR